MFKQRLSFKPGCKRILNSQMTVRVSLQNLEIFCVDFWKYVKKTRVLAFHGGLGAGKTTTINALCKALGVEDATGSPTFSIINEYAYNERGKSSSLFHIDLYRLKGIGEVIEAGVEECLYSGSVCLVEWPERAMELFDEHTFHVLIEPIDERTRMVRVLDSGQFSNLGLAEQL